MGNDNREPKPPAPHLDERTTMRLIVTMADTTWRMFVPTGILVWPGLWADTTFQTKPWLTLLSIPLGLAISILLIKQQLRNTP
jgi:hypothetical protein